MSQIRITPEELREGSTFLGQRLEAINGEVESLKSKIDELTGNWEGAAQSQFITTFTDDMYPIMKEKLPEVIQGIMSQLEGTAKAMEEADQAIADALKVN